MRIYLSILSAHGVTGHTLRAIWNESHASKDHEWMISPQKKAACIDRTRGFILADFLDNQHKPDVFINIDDDVVLPENGMTYVCEQAVKLNALVGPIVQKRATYQGYSCRMPKGTDVPVGDETPILLDGSAAIGGACFAMPRAVAELVGQPRTLDGFIPAHMPFLRRVNLIDGHLYPDAKGEYIEYVSEDFALTARVQAAGGRAYLLPKLSCDHWGEFAYKPRHGWPQEDNTKPRFIQPRYVSSPMVSDPIKAPINEGDSVSSI